MQRVATSRSPGCGQRIDDPDGLAMFAAIRLASSRVRLIARQAVRRGDYVGNRGKSGSARLALETTFMTHNRRERAVTREAKEVAS